MWNFFEQPWTLIGIAIVALLVVLTVRDMLSEKRRWWLLAIPFLIAAAGICLDVFVKTDLEKVRSVLNTGIEAVEQENCGAIEPIIAEDYSDSYHNSKAALMQHCRRLFSEPLIAKNKKRPPFVEVSGSTARIIVVVVAHFDKRSRYASLGKPFVMVKTELRLRKDDHNKWRIHRAEVLEIDKQPMSWSAVR